MKPKEFFDKVSELREAQKEHFKTRSSAALNRSKALDRVIDAEIARVNIILSKRHQYVQGNLFGEGQP